MLCKIFEQAAALADHHQQPAARAVIFFVGLQMLGQMVDAMRQQRDLHVRRTRVLGVRFELSIVFVFASIEFQVKINIRVADCRGVYGV